MVYMFTDLILIIKSIKSESSNLQVNNIYCSNHYKSCIHRRSISEPHNKIIPDFYKTFHTYNINDSNTF